MQKLDFPKVPTGSPRFELPHGLESMLQVEHMTMSNGKEIELKRRTVGASIIINPMGVYSEYIPNTAAVSNTSNRLPNGIGNWVGFHVLFNC